ncbi:transporter substrate-binding domain-containing protein [Aliiroseovarius subalbicans]|uniref:transporter substrate-binding domain-containing protein n=1 Tax=Aliiroseovarius subalbicans TaxID=2925840 RepID=UPI001F598092|nr:transporter substrate-binding domain-containing protein [Aliiroseovarius subalbicans]MCI2398234.1 transporter substrate-binding domain-containing protein [Aliiroseovarius subalbicans]
MKLVTIMLAGLVSLPVQAFAQDVTIGTLADYDPGVFTVDAAALQGFEKALGEALCDRGGLTCTWKVLDAEALLPALQGKDVDVMMGAIPMTRVLGDGIETTAAYLYPDVFDFVGPTGTELHGDVRKVASISDPAIDAWHGSTGYVLELMPTLADAVAAVESGAVDVAVGERADLAPLLAQSDGTVEVVTGNRRLRPGVTMALHADNIDLRFTFEDLIYDMTQDGSLNALTEVWFGKDAYTW